MFLEGGDVVFAFGDPYYHLRLAHFSMSQLPAILQFDPYLNHPEGAHVPWPPLYDLWVAVSARALGGSPHALERVAAWWPPVLGAFSALVVYLGGRRVAGPVCGTLAALVFALLPASSLLSRVGYADHHAAVTCLGAAWLALQLRLLDGGGVRAAAGLAGVRAALVLTWSGSLSYLAVAEVTFIGVAVLGDRRRELGLVAWSLVASAALVLPIVARWTGQLAGPFSPLELSWLHPSLLLALSAWAATSRWTLGALRAAGGVSRAGAGAGLGLVFLAGTLALPGALEGLEQAAVFLGRSDVWGSANPEQVPLFAAARIGAPGALDLFGVFGWAVPVAPFALLALAWRSQRPLALLLLAGWCAGFGAMTLSQVRFAGDLAPSASIAFATLVFLGLESLGERLRLGAGARLAAATGLTLALLLPALRFQLPALTRTLASLGSRSAPARPSPAASFLQFAKQVRQATPETSGFLDPAATPEYGILSDPSLGHALHYVARRATPSDNFGPYIGQEGFNETLRLLLLPPNETTFSRLRGRGLRYVLTGWQPRWRKGSLQQRLHALDGRGEGELPALDRFRLIAEGPENGVPLATPPRGSRPTPYKLFEVVEGARLLVEAAAGEEVTAEVTIQASGKRRFRHRISALADANGRATLRVPYATGTGAEIGPTGPYRVRSAGVLHLVHVNDADVMEGRTVVVDEISDVAGPGC
ncbi:MAG: STT3 domain-containing protein [Myxococcota bacterium]